MRVLNDIFSNIVFAEIKPMFDEMESLFQSLMANYNLDVNEEATDEDVYHLLKEIQVKWDEDYPKHEREWNAYIGLSREIYFHIENNLIPRQGKVGNQEKYFRRADKLEPLRRWIFEIRQTDSLNGVLYYSQRMIQLMNVVELYQKDAPKEILTLRHLFEQGMKRIYYVDPDRYLEMVYDTGEFDHFRNQSVLSFLTSRQVDYDGKVFHNIKWAKTYEAAAIEEKLSMNLKYADLARRNHSKKGHPVEILDSYRIQFGKYGAKNIDGRFHLQRNMNGFVGTMRSSNAIVVGFAGTEATSLKNWWSDYRQFTGHLDPIYLQATGLLNAVWIGKRHRKGYEEAPIIVCGHSLGGGLMQYSVAWMKKAEIYGYGYNSAGISRKNIERLYPIEDGNIFHLYQPNDIVFSLSQCTQLGRSMKLDKVVKSRCKAHRLDSMRWNLKAHKNEIAMLALLRPGIDYAGICV